MGADGTIPLPFSRVSRIKTTSGAVTGSGLVGKDISGHYHDHLTARETREIRDTGERGQAEDTFSDEVGGREQREIGALKFHPEQKQRERASPGCQGCGSPQNEAAHFSPSAGTGRSCSEPGTQLVGGDAAVPNGEGMQPSLHKSGFSAVLVTCCAKLSLVL